MSKRQGIILIAEDDAEDLDHLREAFQELESGWELVHAWNGAEVMAYLSKCDDGNYPVLLVLDFNMPMLNGLEVLVKMAKEERYKPIPKVIYSTSNAPFHMDLCLQAGAHKYFVKPLNKKDLPAIVQEMITIVTLPTQ